MHFRDLSIKALPVVAGGILGLFAGERVAAWDYTHIRLSTDTSAPSDYLALRRACDDSFATVAQGIEDIRVQGPASLEKDRAVLVTLRHRSARAPLDAFISRAIEKADARYRDMLREPLLEFVDLPSEEAAVAPGGTGNSMDRDLLTTAVALAIYHNPDGPSASRQILARKIRALEGRSQQAVKASIRELLESIARDVRIEADVIPSTWSIRSFVGYASAGLAAILVWCSMLFTHAGTGRPVDEKEKR